MFPTEQGREGRGWGARLVMSLLPLVHWLSGTSFGVSTALFLWPRRSHAASDEPPKRKSSRKKKRGSWSEAMEGESPKLSGIFRQPPTGQKRFVYLDPRQPKYGFRLEVSALLPHVCMFAEIVAELGAGGGAH